MNDVIERSEAEESSPFSMPKRNISFINSGSVSSLKPRVPILSLPINLRKEYK